MTRPPLAEAKLAAPRPRAGIVDRARLRAALDAGAGTRLTLVAAPAGSGKTTAVVDWTFASRRRALASVTLDAGDNDPVRLSACTGRRREPRARRARPRRAAAARRRRVDRLRRRRPRRTASRRFAERARDRARRPAHAERRGMPRVDRRAIERLPPHARLVVLSRADPALKIARLRARGALLELRADDLAFTEDEAFELVVRRGGLGLDAREVAVLHRRTEGWPAALFLATLWLRSVDDPRRAVRDFGGDHRFVADYLSTEVLGALDAGLRGFLVRASVLRQFTAELCDDLLDRDDSAATLAELEHVNLFVGRLERGDWYRVHPFSPSTRHSSWHRSSPARRPSSTGERPGGSARAGSRTRRSSTPPPPATTRSSRTSWSTTTRSLLRSSGGARVLVRRVETLPDAQLVEHPELAAGRRLRRGHDRRAHDREEPLPRARRHSARPDSYADAVAQTVRCHDRRRRLVARRFARVGARSRPRRERRTSSSSARSPRTHMRSTSPARPTRRGRPRFAPSSIRSAERQPAGHVLARTTLALVAAERGRVASARSHAEQARTIVGRAASSRSWLGANASAALGVVLAAERRPDRSRARARVRRARLPRRGRDGPPHLGPRAARRRRVPPRPTSATRSATSTRPPPRSPSSRTPVA